MFGKIFNKKDEEQKDANAPQDTAAGATPAADQSQATNNSQQNAAPTSGAEELQPQTPATPTDNQSSEAQQNSSSDQQPVSGQATDANQPPTENGENPEQSNVTPDGSQPNADAKDGEATDVEKKEKDGSDMSSLSHLDPRATQALTHATEETKRIKQQYIEPDQVLLGLLYDQQLYATLGEMGADGGQLSKEIQASEKMGVYKAQPTLSKTSQEVFDQAYRDSKMRGANFVSPEDILIVLFDQKYTTGGYLAKHNLQKEKVIEKFSKNPKTAFGKKTVLEKYGVDLTEEARAGKLDPIAGRDKEIDRMIHILLRRSKNNPIIIGETGVGKTAIVEGLAQKIVSGNVPKDLQEKRIFQLDVSSLVAGASHRGEFEERLRAVINEVLGSNNRIMLFIDEIHVLMGTGEDGAMNTANIIKPHLARGHFQLIGATTTIEYRKNFEKDKAFERRFQPVIAEEPSEENAVEMLKVLRPKYEKFHRVSLPDDALKECVKLSKKYIGERYLPDKAVDLLDEACSEVKLQLDGGKRGNGDTAIKKADIEKVVSAWTGIPITKLTEDESEKLLKLEDRIHQRLIDQVQAVVAVSEAVRRGRIGLAAANRPIASFVFLGPTGVGKTELAKTLAELLFGRDDAMARLDMSEYQEKHEVAKLIGAPPGYVGYEEGGQLTEAVRKKPYSIVLMDEIEKAHPDVFNILLQLLEDGRLTDNKGNTISFKNTIVICTSNIGSMTIQKFLSTQDPKAKFTQEQTDDKVKELQKVVREELIKFFRPELLNRFDEVVIFKPLMQEHMAGIARLGISKTAKLLKEQGFNLQITDKAVDQLAIDGYDPVYGARPLRRLIQTAIENPIAIAIISKKFVTGDTIVIDYNSNTNEFFFTKDGGAEEVAPLTDDQFKTVLLQLANPDSVANITDRQRFMQVHDQLVKARSENNKTASAILEVTSATDVKQVQDIRKQLEAAKAKGDAVAEAVLSLASSMAHQIQASLKLKSILLEIINPESIAQPMKKERFRQLHDKVTQESQRENALALKILAVNESTPANAIDELMQELKTASDQGDDLAEVILSAVNTEIVEEADAAHDSEPTTKFKNVMKQIINPLYAADPENKAKFSSIYDKITQAEKENNPMAQAILTISDLTSDSDIAALQKQLEEAKAKGDPLAAEILEAVAQEIKLEPIRKLKSTLLLVNNPVMAKTPQEQEQYTNLQTKVTEASQKGDAMATAIIAVKDTSKVDEIKAILDQINQAVVQKNELALLIQDISGVSASEETESTDEPAPADAAAPASAEEKPVEENTSTDAPAASQSEDQSATTDEKSDKPSSEGDAKAIPSVDTATNTPDAKDVPTASAETTPQTPSQPAQAAPSVPAAPQAPASTPPAAETGIVQPPTQPTPSAVDSTPPAQNANSGTAMQPANAYQYSGIPMASRPMNYIAPQSRQEEIE